MPDARERERVCGCAPTRGRGEVHPCRWHRGAIDEDSGRTEAEAGAEAEAEAETEAVEAA